MQAETERERLERVKIEEKLAPRSLSPEQQDALIAKLKPFAGQVLDLFVYNSGDAMGVGERLLFALRSSNWQVSAGSGTEMGRSVHGILVEVAEEADVPSRTAAEALVAALNAERLVTLGPQPIDRRHARSFTGDNLGRALIQLVVGEKP